MNKNILSQKDICILDSCIDFSYFHILCKMSKQGFFLSLKVMLLAVSNREKKNAVFLQFRRKKLQWQGKQRLYSTRNLVLSITGLKTELWIRSSEKKQIRIRIRASRKQQLIRIRSERCAIFCSMVRKPQ